MDVRQKDPLVPVSFRIKRDTKNWLAEEAAHKHDRSVNWLLNKVLEEAMSKSKQNQEVMK